MAVFKVRRFEMVDGRREFDGPAYLVESEHVRFVSEAFPSGDDTGGWLVTPMSVISVEEAAADWAERTGAFLPTQPH